MNILTNDFIDIPTESYKVLQDKINSLEKDNKELREWIKDKDILIQQQSRRIHELTEVRTAGE